MSAIENSYVFHYQRLTTSITYSSTEQTFINSLKPFQGDEWDGKLTTRGRAVQARRNELKTSIRVKLEAIQTEHCIYCGIHRKLVGPLQREHIAPKSKYHDFVFAPKNLALACQYCNGFLKKKNFDTISRFYTDYNKCKFYIIHPYFDDFRDYIEFEYSSNEIFIKPKGKSRKGKTTIKLFELDENMQTTFRAASIMQSHLTLTDDQEDIIRNILKRDYTR